VKVVLDYRLLDSTDPKEEKDFQGDSPQYDDEEEEDDKAIFQRKVFIFLLEESLKQNKFILHMDSNLELEIRFRMDDKSVKKTKEVVKTIKKKININLVKQITITSEFMIKVTTMRRILDDVELYLNRRNILLDLKILTWVFLLIFNPIVFAFLFFFYLYFFVNMHHVNHFILTKMLYYFSEFSDEDDEKKNLVHIQKTQTGWYF
jgi:hypothetical protein